MICLASAYSHPDSAVREQRFRAACHAVAALFRAGYMVFSPVIHSHPLVEYGLPTGWEFWERLDRRHLEDCNEVVALMLDGWQGSIGMQSEIRLARELGKPVRYVSPETAIGSPTFATAATNAES